MYPHLTFFSFQGGGLGGEANISGEYHPQTPHSYHGTNPQYHPKPRGATANGGATSAGGTPALGNGGKVGPDQNGGASTNNTTLDSIPPLPASQPPATYQQQQAVRIKEKKDTTFSE